jgi:hypothetical protein
MATHRRRKTQRKRHQRKQEPHQRRASQRESMPFKLRGHLEFVFQIVLKKKLWFDVCCPELFSKG